MQVGWQWNRMQDKGIAEHIGKFFYSYRYIPVLLFTYVSGLFVVISGKIKVEDTRLKYLAVCGMIFLLVAIRTAEPQHMLYCLPFLAIAASTWIFSLNTSRIQTRALGNVIVILFVGNGMLHAGYFSWKYGIEEGNETSHKRLSHEVASNLVGATTIILDGYPELSWEIRHSMPQLRIIEPPFFTNTYMIEALTLADHIVMPRGFRVHNDELEIDTKVHNYQSHLFAVGRRAYKIAEVGVRRDWSFSARIYKIVKHPEFTSDQNSR